METQHGVWLRAMASAGKGGVTLPQIDRGLAYELTLKVPLDVSGDTFSSSLRLAPDADGSTLADFAVSVGSWDGTYTPVTLTLTSEQVNALPGDSDADGLVELVIDVLRDPTGSGIEYRYLGGNIFVVGSVTDA